MLLLGAFAGLALLLASIGLYGVLAYAVVQRSRELGLRMALGATSGSVMRLVVARGLSLTAIGLAAGVALAWAVTRTRQNVLYGVTASDPAHLRCGRRPARGHRRGGQLPAGPAGRTARSDRGAARLVACPR